MHVSKQFFPSLESLTSRLTATLYGDACAGALVVADRTPFVGGTAPKEIVTCRLPNGSEVRLFCKYALDNATSGQGHRGGVPYEVTIYRDVLSAVHGYTPRFYGAGTDSVTGETWLVLEYLDGSMRLSKTPEPSAMRLAAQWIARFHAAGEERLASALLPPLITYDTEYYLQWCRQTHQFVDRWDRHAPWLASLCERFESLIAPLLTSPVTIIHGEYYGKNVLARGSVIYPVDWESTALAVGEIDLASLTEFWPNDVVRQCEMEYERVRWPDGPPHDHKRRLDAARVYLQFRWLCDEPDATKSVLKRLEELRRVGKRLELV